MSRKDLSSICLCLRLRARAVTVRWFGGPPAEANIREASSGAVRTSRNAAASCPTRHPDHPESDVGERPAPILPEDEPSDNGGESRGWQARVLTAVGTVVETVDKVQRWQLESDEPDATGKWKDKEHRKKVLRYVWKRDGRRCGLCAGEMKFEGAHIEHIVPKVFAVFDIRKGGKAVEGTRYKSRLHKLDNLQAAHTYCNRRKGNTTGVSKWRHPNMPALTVADTDDGKEFVVPWKPTRKRAHPRTRRP